MKIEDINQLNFRELRPIFSNLPELVFTQALLRTAFEEIEKYERMFDQINKPIKWFPLQEEMNPKKLFQKDPENEPHVKEESKNEIERRKKCQFFIRGMARIFGLDFYQKTFDIYKSAPTQNSCNLCSQM